MKLQVFANTTRGKEVNLDSFAYDLDLGVFLIADGVTGAVYKPMSLDIRRTASQDACSHVLDYLKTRLPSDGNAESHLEKAIRRANDELLQQAGKNPSLSVFNNAIKSFNSRAQEYFSRISADNQEAQNIKSEIEAIGASLLREDNSKPYETTLAALVFQDSWAYESHVGDSRIYVLKKDGSIEHTEDLLDKSNEPVTVGGKQAVEIKKGKYLLDNVDKFLLVTDGVSNALTQEDIRSILLNNNPQNAVTELLRRANYDPSEEAVKQFASKHRISAGEARSILSGGDDCTAIVVWPTTRTMEEVLAEQIKYSNWARQEISGLKYDVLTGESTLAKANSRISSLEEENKNKGRYVADLESQIRNSSENQDSTRKAIEEKDREIISLKELSGSQEQELDKYSENFDKLSESFEERCHLLVKAQKENFTLTKSIADQERRLSSALGREAELKKIIGDYAGLTETMKKNLASIDEIIKQKDAEISESRQQASLSDRRRIDIETKANEIIRYQKDFLGIIKTIEDNISKYDLQSGKLYNHAVDQFNSGNYAQAAELFGKTALDSPDAGKAKAYLGIISLQKESEKLQSEQNHSALFGAKLRILADIVKHDPENKTAVNQKKEELVEYAKSIGYYQKRKDLIEMLYSRIDRKLEGK